MDNRDALPWVAVELTPLGESKALAGGLVAQIQRDLGVDPDSKHPDIFLPIRTHIRGRRSISVALMHGYLFIEAGLTDTLYFELERYAYCERVISGRGGYGLRVLNTIPANEIAVMRKKLAEMVASDLHIGQRVSATGGRYNGMTGTVHHLGLRTANVGFDLRSLHIIDAIPRILLEPEDLE